jgi:hypothetical protein
MIFGKQIDGVFVGKQNMKIFHFHNVFFRENGTKKKKERKNLIIEMHCHCKSTIM